MLDPYRFGSGATDPTFANVSILLHMDGADGGIVFTDSSTNNHSVTVFQATTSTTQIKYGATSGFFNGNHQLSVAHHASLDLTTGDFTIEGWVYLTSSSAISVITHKTLNTGYRPFEIGHDATGHFYAKGWGADLSVIYTITDATALTNNVWYHFALTRNGSTFTLWINGASVGTPVTSASALYTSATDPLHVGRFGTGVNALTGHVDDFRIKKGEALYTSPFTPPTAAFPDA